MPVPFPDPDAPLPAPLPLVPVPPELRDELNPFTNVQTVDTGETFRVGELSRRSGVAVGTIKFYLREGLLQPGEATAKTQALYGIEHLRRLRIIRVLSEVGGLSIAQIRSVVETLEDDSAAPGDLSRVVSYTLAASAPAATARRGKPDDENTDAIAEARALTDEWLDAIGMVVNPESPARQQLAEAYAALQALGLTAHPIIFTEHARLAYELAQFEIGALSQRVGMSDAEAERKAVDEMVVGTVVFGAAFMALRAMAHEHEVWRRLLNADDPPPPTPSEP